MNIIVTGVGGQGNILLSQTIGECALRKGMSVTIAEIHGMAQRGGFVLSELRINERSAPLIPDREADLVISLEPIESLRVLNKCSTETIVIINTEPIIPFHVALGKDRYPATKEILSKLKSKVKKVVAINATKAAESLGLYRIVNIVMLGASAKYLPLSELELKKTIKKIIPKKYVALNLKAFELGTKAALKAILKQ
jgi:indolepyruvate ferredoxin oxidoreductase beta subunit